MPRLPRTSRRSRWPLAAALAGLVFTVPACETTETGRRRINPHLLISPSAEIEMGVEAYKQYLGQAKISQDKAANDLVRRVGNRIREVTPQAGDYTWEFTVVDDPKTVNAFCLPGGKVVVFTGILPVTKDEAGLATVLGHEVAHAVESHGAERMVRSTLIQLALQGGETALQLKFQNRDPGTVNAIMMAFGVGAQVGLELPFDRAQESDADELGLMYMAKAGYDPAQAIEFWKRMSTLSGGGAQPEFLSTHPSHETRVEHLQRLLPKARAEYERSPHRTPAGGR